MKRHIVVAIILILMILLSGCAALKNDATSPATAPSQRHSLPQTADSSKLVVHFLDVGQADSILVQFPGGDNMLVDAGNNDDGPAVVNYLKQQGITNIEYLIGTHPHEDHIGGLDDVIRAFTVDKVYMPKVTSTTRTFEEVVLALKDKGQKIISARAGESILEQDNVKADIIAPCQSSYKDTNDFSAVIRIQCGDTVFLLTGDAGSKSEQDLLASGVNLCADVLKVSHHGSSDATTAAFLKKVAPQYAIISVGAGNDYGHPHRETLAALSAAGVQVYRTDRDGTVVFIADGKGLTVKLNDSVTLNDNSKSGEESSAFARNVYVGNSSSKKFHRPTCSSLPAPQNRIGFKTRGQALKAGFEPCKNCNP